MIRSIKKQTNDVVMMMTTLHRMTMLIILVANNNADIFGPRAFESKKTWRNKYVSKSTYKTLSFSSVKAALNIFENTENFLKFPALCVISSTSGIKITFYKNI